MLSHAASTPGDKIASKRVLDPIERSSEIMFGLIMALTFTCTISVASSTRLDVATMLAGALGCNIAWGLVDAAMYILAQIVERERRRGLVNEVATASRAEAHRILMETLPDGLSRSLSARDLDRIVEAARQRPVGPRRAGPTAEDLRGAVAIFLLVFLSTVPVALPFMFMGDVAVALRTSNAIAVTLLFLVGMGLGKHMRWQPYWVTGLVVALFGAILVAITIALGG